MHIAYPIFLLAGGILLLPVILHFLRRRPREEKVFPSLFFLEQYTVTASRRNRIRKWILLLLRLSILALILLIFAWPYFSAAKRTTESATVLLVDQSFSTWAPPVRAWMDRVIAEELSKISPENPVMMGLVSDKILWTKEFYTDPEIPQAFRKQNASAVRRSTFRSALLHADAMLRKRDAKHRKIVIVGDRQRLPWNDVDFSRRLTATDEIVHLAYPENGEILPNPAVLSADVREHVSQAQSDAQTFTVQSVAANYSAKECRAKLEVEFAGGHAETADFVLKPGEVRRSETIVKLPQPVSGPASGFVRLIPSDPGSNVIEVDDLRYFSWNPSEKSRVVKARNLRSGAELFLETALTNAGRDGTDELKYVPEKSDGPKTDTASDLYIAEGALPNAQNAYAAIRSVLDNRGSAVIVYQDSKPMRDLLSRFGFEIEKRRAPGTYSFEMINFDHPLFLPYRNLRIGSWFEILFFDVPVLKIPPGADVAAAFTGGIPAVLDLPFGEGHLYVICSPLDKKHTTWATTSMFLPFWREMVSLSARTARKSFNFDTSSAGGRIPRATEAADFSAPGNFMVPAAGSGAIAYSVNPPAAESDLAAVFSTLPVESMAARKTTRDASGTSPGDESVGWEQPDADMVLRLMIPLLVFLLLESLIARRTSP